MAEWSFDELAASLAGDSRDVSIFHEVLAEKLARAFPPGQVNVRRKGWPLGGQKPLQALNVELDGVAFSLEQSRRGFEYRRAKIVRGIALKTETLSLSEWLSSLTQALWQEAQKSEATREALERFLIGGG